MVLLLYGEVRLRGKIESTLNVVVFQRLFSSGLAFVQRKFCHRERRSVGDGMIRGGTVRVMSG